MTWFRSPVRDKVGAQLSRRGRRPALECLEDRCLLSTGIAEIPLFHGGFGIVTGPDGNLWLAETAGQIARVTPAGTIKEFPVPTSSGSPQGITVGPDGNLWFTEFAGNKIGRITLSGAVTEFDLPTANSEPYGITRGPDGNLWFTEAAGNQIGRITPGGAITEFAVPTTGSQPFGIVSGPDGNLWFNEFGGDKVSSITPAGTITEYLLPGSASGPQGIVAGPDGTLWFAEAAGNRIGHITTSGFLVAEFLVPSASANPNGMTLGPNGTIAFSEPGAARIGLVHDILDASPAYVQALYQSALGRLPSTTDESFWVNQSVQNGINTVASGIERSAEARTHLVDGWFEQYLGHPSVGNEDQFFASQLVGGATEEQVLSELLGSQEYFNHAPQVPGVGGGSPSGSTFVDALYLQLLGREPGQADFLYWGGQLQVVGTTGVALGILTSAEYRSDVVTSYFTNLLRQPGTPNPAGVVFWVNSGLDLTSIRVGFESSLEFLTLYGVVGTAVTEITGQLGSGSEPFGIVAGSDGNFWFTQENANQIGRLSPTGALTFFPVPTSAANPQGITVGPDGNLWFAEHQGDKIGRLTPAGVFTEFALPAGGDPTGIATGPDGNLWFTEQQGNAVGRITPAGTVTLFPVPTAASSPTAITAGPDGNLWFTEQQGNKIGRVTTGGALSEFAIPTAQSTPSGITAGPDGNLWFTEYITGKIGKVTSSGQVTELTIPTGDVGPSGIVTGPDGNLWFTEFNSNKIGQVTPAGLFAAEFTLATPSAGAAGIALGPQGLLGFTESTGNNVGLVRGAADANRAYIQAVFHDALGRPAAATDLSYWLGVQAQSGNGAVASGVERSPEARTRLVDGWFVNYLGHQAVGGEDQFFADQLVNGATEEQVLSELLGTQEYVNHSPQVPGVGGGSPSGTTFVEALYLQLLGRPAGQADLNYWGGQLQTLGLSGVAYGILTSAEYRSDVVTSYFTNLLHQSGTPDPAGVAFWVNSGLDLTGIRVGFESSLEFFVNG